MVLRGQDGVEVKTMIDLLLGKKDMLCYLQNMRVVRAMGRVISNHHVVLCKVRLVGTWNKRREVVDGARGIRNEKQKEHQYREGGGGKRVEIAWTLVCS